MSPGCLRQSDSRPLVLLLASLWAGPLAAHLLGLAGARVVTVESSTRPDGFRRGAARFHDLLHAGQEMVALDLPQPHAVKILRALIEKADIVIDGSRPRAMRQLGIDVDEAVVAGTSWVSITGYGRTGPWANLPAFGDDAAAAAGLVAWDDRGPLPAGEAIADPLTGVHAALAAQAALMSDRTWLIDVAMREVALTVAHLPVSSAGILDVEPAPPFARRPLGPARAAGADNRALIKELGLTNE